MFVKGKMTRRVLLRLASKVTFLTISCMLLHFNSQLGGGAEYIIGIQ